MPHKDPYQAYLRNLRYYQENKEKLNKGSREYNHKNSLRIKQQKAQHYQTNKERIKQDQKNYRDRTKKEKREYNKKYRGQHREHLLELSRNYYYESGQNEIAKRKHEELKKQAYEILGNKCSNPNCAVVGGMTDLRALQIDHINGGGRKEMKEIKSIGVYRKIINGDKSYQILCANCNWIKRYEKGEAKKDKLAVLIKRLSLEPV